MSELDINEQYSRDAARTLTGEYFGKKVSREFVLREIQNFIDAAERIDAVKRVLFYGIAPTAAELPTGELDAAELPAADAEQLLHGILGIAGEAGELLEIAAKLFGGIAVDRVNLKEECGDVLWYIATTLGSANITITEAQRANIAKLAKRYPNKFTLYNALNRDLFAEREVLTHEPSATLIVSIGGVPVKGFDGDSFIEINPGKDNER